MRFVYLLRLDFAVLYLIILYYLFKDLKGREITTFTINFRFFGAFWRNFRKRNTYILYYYHNFCQIKICI